MKLQLLTVFSLLQLSAGNPRLVCEETVETLIRHNVILRCHMEPEENIQHEMVEVTKVDSNALVYSYYNGRQLGDFYEQSRYGTFLNFEDLKIGVVNLNINSVRKSDQGMYRIYIYTPTKRISSTVTLIVGNPLLVCQETVEALMGHDVVLPCHMEPKQNIENDEVKCRRSDSEVLVYARRNGEQLANYMNQYRHRMSVNTEDLKIGVLNLKISSVRKSDKGTYKIYIHTWGVNSTVTLSVGVPLGILIGVPVVYFILALVVVVVVWILMKHKVIRRCCTRMMKRRDLKSQHDDEDPHRAAVNYPSPPEHPAERETMMELEL